MPSIYDEIDVNFGWAGDFNLGDSGDIKDTNDNPLQSLLDQIHLICASAFGDWEIYPNKGAGLDDFVGERNTKYIADQINNRIRIALTSAGIVADEDLEVRIIPVHIHKVLVLIRIGVVATTFNKLEEGELLQTALVFDSLEQEVFFLDKTPNLVRT